MIKENYEQLKDAVGNDVNIIAVTKYHTVEDTLNAYDAGVRDFGENRVDGFIEKRSALPEDATVHYIGTLQSRKVKDIINDLTYLHSLERESVAEKIEQYAEHAVKCFIQVNVSGEDSKHGIGPDDVDAFMEKMAKYDKVKVVGLMTMAPLTDDTDVIDGTFSRLSALKDGLNDKYPTVTELSMGMSSDYGSAVKHGATYVRIGSKIMGK